jgi:hypothetical protein
MSCPYGPCDLRLSSDNPTAVAGRVLCGGPAEQNTGGCGVSRNIIKFIKFINISGVGVRFVMSVHDGGRAGTRFDS